VIVLFAGCSSVAAPVATTTAQDVAASNTRAAPATVAAHGLHHVHVVDATFVGPEDGWLLAAADCAGGSGTCTAMLRTTDGGAHWRSMPNPPANVPGVKGCRAACVEHVRFADDGTGYAYGTSAFYMTTDGGVHWAKQPGGAVALESLAGNVIRITTVEPGCTPPGCHYAVETAGIGSTRWTTRGLGTTEPGMGPYPLLVRGGRDAYLLVMGHPAGGAPRATSTLYRSTDAGAHWTDAGEPCPQTGGEVDSTLVAAGAGARVAVVCMTRQAPQHSFVAVSTDAGAHFVATDRAPWRGTRFLAGDPDTVLLAAGGSHVYRSTDGGRRWRRVTLRDLTGNVTWVGFESATVGHIVGGDDSTIWTTRDGGARWTAVHLG
jgi:photosystem II stability/assembly factor-like uncharacterized protein